MPSVSVLTPVYNGEAYLAEALASARAQEHEPLELIVVDDGSSDASAEIARAHGAHVIRQANAGTAGAVNAAREAARGDVLALLDADDRWPPDKLARQLEALGDAGLLYGDMTVIDGAGEIVRESWLESVWDGPPPSGERCFGALLSANPATQSSILLRAGLSRRLGPAPPHLRAADWWLALSAARAGAIAYLAEPRTWYRFHDGNIGLGSEGPALGRAHARRAVTQRVFLADVRAEELTPLELAHAWNAFERNVAEALKNLGNPFATVIAVADADRERCASELATAHEDPAQALASAVRALAADPWSQAAHEALQHAWERAAVSLPHVTALVTAYNVERFVGEALDSALAQDYEGRLDVLAVDDGSTDGTADELAARPVRVVRQENGGYIAASNRAIAEAEGDLLALLDGDDAWPADKIRRQVEALGGAGLLYGDMVVIDGDGAEIDPSWLDDAEQPRTLAQWLSGNVATSSSILVRAELARRFCPIPPEIPFTDWYLAVRAWQESTVVYLPEPRTYYRFHGENMSLGTSGAKRAGQLRDAMALQRWFLRRIGPEHASWAAYAAFEAFARELQEVAESPFTPLVDVTAEDRAAARRELERAPGDLAAAIRALAADPWCEAARQAALDLSA